MKITLLAIGRLKSGPEKHLVDDYQHRFDRSARALGLGPLTIQEIEPRKKTGQAAEAAALAEAIPPGAWVIALDERGKLCTSPQFAEDLARLRDAGQREVVFVIGGADGLTPALRDRADALLSFGRMVWPHMLARVMLSEQLYRAAGILSGSPYHRV